MNNTIFFINFCIFLEGFLIHFLFYYLNLQNLLFLTKKKTIKQINEN